jgi:hypothetical protein
MESNPERHVGRTTCFARPSLRGKTVKLQGYGAHVNGGKRDHGFPGWHGFVKEADS